MKHGTAFLLDGFRTVTLYELFMILYAGIYETFTNNTKTV